MKTYEEWRVTGTLPSGKPYEGKERRGWCRLTDAGLRAAPDLTVFQTSLETSLDLAREV